MEQHSNQGGSSASNIFNKVMGAINGKPGAPSGPYQGPPVGYSNAPGYSQTLPPHQANISPQGHGQPSNITNLPSYPQQYVPQHEGSQYYGEGHHQLGSHGPVWGGGDPISGAPVHRGSHGYESGHGSGGGHGYNSGHGGGHGKRH
ncbi:g472 [Coccomyxa elongata]